MGCFSLPNLDSTLTHLKCCSYFRMFVLFFNCLWSSMKSHSIFTKPTLLALISYFNFEVILIGRQEIRVCRLFWPRSRMATSCYDDIVKHFLINPFMHNVVKWPNILEKSCEVYAARFLKYVWPFYNIMLKGLNYDPWKFLGIMAGKSEGKLGFSY